MGEIILEPKLLSFLVAAFIFLPFFRFISLSHDLYYRHLFLFVSYSLDPLVRSINLIQLSITGGFFPK